MCMFNKIMCHALNLKLIIADTTNGNFCIVPFFEIPHSFDAALALEKMLCFEFTLETGLGVHSCPIVLFYSFLPSICYSKSKLSLFIILNQLIYYPSNIFKFKSPSKYCIRSYESLPLSCGTYSTSNSSIPLISL